MNNKEFIASLAAKSGYSLDDTQKLVSSVVGFMGKKFGEGDAVAIPGFGSFEVKKRLERVMVNPSTGQRMLVPPKLVLNFKPASRTKERIKNGGAE